MIEVIISGYGKMGHIVEEVLRSRGIPCTPTEDVCATPEDVARRSVCVDFTTPDAFRANYKWIAAHFKAAVIGTTGWNDIRQEVLAAFEASGCTMIWSSNFSLGVLATMAAVQAACKVLNGNGYTPSIEEIHHIHKLDAPSGTAKSLGAIVEEALGEVPQISSVREGEVPGIHTVELLSSVDKISIRHEAFSREGLARGAVEAALMTEDLSGVHEFKDLIL